MRIGMTAKTFGVRPSDYLPELGTWERYCFDELVAIQMAIEEQKQIEEAKSKAGRGDPKPPSPKKKDVPGPHMRGVDLMNHEAFRKKK